LCRSGLDPGGPQIIRSSSGNSEYNIVNDEMETAAAALDLTLKNVVKAGGQVASYFFSGIFGNLDYEETHPDFDFVTSYDTTQVE
jgi:hypothetical protein